MNRRGFFFVGLGFGVLAGPKALGQIQEILQEGQGWLEDNLDPRLLDVLESVESGNATRVEKLLKRATSSLQGEYVLDLASLAEASHSVLPLLEAHPETRPYASWLRAHLDYFDAAELLQEILPAPVPSTGQPNRRPAVPTPTQARQAWERKTGKQKTVAADGGWPSRLKPIFRSTGTPAPLVWLAEIESSFDPRARSPVGAVGLYQLMPATARDLGLRLTPTDERLIPEKNSRAAAIYLKQLWARFKDWRLALAAFNAGPGRVQEVLKRRNARSFDAIAPSLPAETQLYVPRFETVLRRREGIALTALPAAR